jgi:ABC-type glycerol-3-phosphate transport system substrate-binding protein
MGLLPTNQAALKTLTASQDNKVMMDSVLQILPTIEPVIPGGPPTWYTKFSAEAAATIQSVALGQVTAAKAVDDLAQKTKQFAAQAK